MLHQHYPRQFTKLLNFVLNKYIAKIRALDLDEENKAALNVLQHLVTDTLDQIKKRGTIPQQEERTMPEFKEEDDTRDASGDW